MTKKREIQIAKKRVGDLKFEMQNPRKIKKRKREELQKSLENLGDFNVISGFQRAQVLADMDPDQLVDCKVLVGYTEKEKKIINIKPDYLMISFLGNNQGHNTKRSLIKGVFFDGLYIIHKENA